MARSGIAGSYGNSILVFWGTTMLFSVLNLRSHQQCLRVPFPPHPLQYLLFQRVFNDGHSDLCEVVPHCRFDLRLSDN